MSSEKNIFHLTAAATLMAAAVSCMSADALRPGMDPSETFALSGSVYSKDDATSPKPINGIRVVISSYGRRDRNKAVAITADTVFTDVNGRYAATPARIRDCYYVMEAQDIDGEENGGTYSPGQIEMMIDRNCKSMDFQDFYLSRK